MDSDTGHLRSTFGFGIMPGSHSNLLPTNQGIINTTLQNTLTRVSRPRVVETHRIPVAPDNGRPPPPPVHLSLATGGCESLMRQHVISWILTSEESRRSVHKPVRRYISYNPFVCRRVQCRSGTPSQGQRSVNALSADKIHTCHVTMVAHAKNEASVLARS